MINEKEVLTFFEILSRNQVQYLIIGGAAVNIYGYTRATGDLDIWYNPTQQNFLKLMTSIQEFGYDISELQKVTEYERKGFIRLPLERFSLELLSVIDGKIKFEEAFARATVNEVSHGLSINIIGYDDLIENKIMSRRSKDLEDIKQLERLRNREVTISPLKAGIIRIARKLGIKVKFK